jgi:DNA-binding NarL/FixJ family response regulator
MIRVVLADDEALVRGGFRYILDSQEDMTVVGEAADGLAAIELARAQTPDVVVMDIRMPKVDGVEATKRIVARGNGPRILVLTTFDLDEHLYDAMRAGASGFLLKDAPPEHLLNAVRTVAAGDTLLAPALTRRLIERFLREPPPAAHRTGPIPSLSEREGDVLRLIAAGRSNRDIARDLHLSEATVKSHVSRVFRKLGVNDRAQAVVMAYETGFVRPGQTPPEQSRPPRSPPARA